LKSNHVSHCARKGTSLPRIVILLSWCLLYLVQFPGGSVAASLTGDSRTYVQSWKTLDDKTVMPFYEYLNFSVQDMGKESISLHVSGWWYDSMTDAMGSQNRKDTDLQYGYVSYRGKEYNTTVNLGRVMVFEGIAAERVDGIYARTDIKGGFGISAFGGVPVETEGDTAGNNAIVGGRVSHQMAGLYAIGASFVKEEKNSNNYRNEQGIDLWFRPFGKVELMGRSSYNAETKGWMENTYYLVLGPFDKLRFNTEYSKVDYEDYFSAVTTSALTPTSWGFINTKEKVTILGEEVFYSVNKEWTASVDYRYYGYQMAGNAFYYGVKATYAVPKSYNAGLSIHKMDSDNNALKYDEYRIYASKKINKVDVAIDLLDIKYAEPRNNVTNAYSATIAAGYELVQDVKVGLDLAYAKNPDYDKDVRMFVKFVWGFDAGGKAQAPAAQKAAPVAELKQAPPAAETVQPAPVVIPVPAPLATDTAQPAPAAVSEQPAVPQSGTEQGKPKEGN
jgi:hypothetical protein